MTRHQPRIDYDVLVLGGVGVDTIVRVPELRIPEGDLLVVPPVRDYVAHSGNGVALGFHTLGLRTKFADLLGDDALGDLVRARYAKVGLDFTALPAENGTPRSVNLVDSEGRRFSFYDGRHPADAQLPREFYLPMLERSKHVHVAGRARAAFEDARELGVSTSTDIHAWDGETAWPKEYAYEAQFVFMSAAAAPDRVDAIMRDILANGRADFVVATEGADGSRILTRAEPDTVRRYPIAASERPVVDSNGAGDAFSTAFMTSWFAGRPLDECMHAGAVSGAFACGAHGTHEEQITQAELEAALGRAVFGRRSQ
jgi:sugar/nucleoside kinase (ribokinase family)